MKKLIAGIILMVVSFILLIYAVKINDIRIVKNLTNQNIPLTSKVEIKQDVQIFQVKTGGEYHYVYDVETKNYRFIILETPNNILVLDAEDKL